MLDSENKSHKLLKSFIKLNHKHFAFKTTIAGLFSPQELTVLIKEEVMQHGGKQLALNFSQF